MLKRNIKLSEDKGKVTDWFPNKQYGYIKLESGKSVFFHYSVVVDPKGRKGIKAYPVIDVGNSVITLWDSKTDSATHVILVGNIYRNSNN